MKKLIPLLTLTFAVFAGDLLAQDKKDDKKADPPKAEEKAKVDDADTKKADEPNTDGEPAKVDQEEAEAKTVDDAAPAPTFDDAGNSGDTAWMTTAAVLVLFMTIPGLSLFYGGLVRSKNYLSILVQCFAITCMMSLLWIAYGYGWSAEGGGKYFGDFSNRIFLGGYDSANMSGPADTIPESTWIVFQMTFAIITPALMVGAFAERMKFSAVLIFSGIWFTLSYIPIWHMAWGSGLFHGGDDGNWLIGKGEGVLDLAGGTVVHINAGIAALVACIVLGARKGFPSGDMKPHSAGLTVVGASILWVGWFGFNAGSAFTSGTDAGHAMLVTQVATATAALAWMFCEWFGKSGKPTAVGIATGAVAGLVAITPASGNVGPIGAIVIGVAAGAICYWASTSLKKSLGYDDSLDVFGVHCVGGIVGCVLTGVCSYAWIGGSGGSEAGMGTQVMVQIKSAIFTLIWSGVAAYIAIKIADVCCDGIRSSEDDETEGLDVTVHGEEGYNL